MKLITIKHNGMPFDDPEKKGYRIVTGQRTGHDARGPGEAAAIALDAALGQNGRYYIVGCDEVMKLIPEELRRRD